MNKIGKTSFFVIVLLIGVTGINAQSTTNVLASKYIKLQLDSIEINRIYHKKGKNTKRSLHMGLINQTQDTIRFVTNSCPSYRVYKTNFQQQFSIPNSGVRCSYNIIQVLTLLPDSSIHITEPLWCLDTSFDASFIKVMMVLPLFPEKKYGKKFRMLYYENERVNKMAFDIIAHPESLVYVGNVPVKMNIIDNRKKKKKQRRKK